MQGVSFDLMRKYAVAQLGETAWAIIMTSVGRPGQEYEVGKSYPGVEFDQIAMLVAQARNKSLPNVLEGFGEAMAVEVINVYGFLVDQRWSYVDFLLNMQPMLDSAFQLEALDASTAPKMNVSRTGPEEVSITYESSRRACGIVRGACRGAAAHYGVEVDINDEKCVLRGDPACVITVRSRHA